MKKRVIKLALLIFWLTLIYYFSSQNGSSSQNTSDSLFSYFYGLYSKFGNLSKSEFLLCYGQYFRKLAHFSEYFVLGILVYINLIEYIDRKVVLVSIVLCVLFAISDEVHQLFVEERAFGVLDIIIDSLGSIISILLTNKYINDKKN